MPYLSWRGRSLRRRDRINFLNALDENEVVKRLNCYVHKKSIDGISGSVRSLNA